jgi:hypothetical protein
MERRNALAVAMRDSMQGAQVVRQDRTQFVDWEMTQSILGVYASSRCACDTAARGVLPVCISTFPTASASVRTHRDPHPASSFSQLRAHATRSSRAVLEFAVHRVRELFVHRLRQVVLGVPPSDVLPCASVSLGRRARILRPLPPQRRFESSLLLLLPPPRVVSAV